MENKRFKDIKLIVTDLDGTLLNQDKKISEETAEVLRQASAKGIDICIATGRFIHDIKPEMDEIGIKPYYINMNGSEVRYPNGNLIKEVNIPDKYLQEIHDYIVNADLVPEYYTNRGECLVDTTKDRSLREIIMRMSYLMPHKKITEEDALNNIRFIKRKYEDSIEDLLKSGLKVRKILAFADDFDKIAKIKKHFNSYDDLVCVSALPNNLEVTHKEAQKGPALKNLIEAIKISPEEVLIFGDGENDYSMFELFNNAVAMENSMKQVLDKAKYITKSNAEDGVAYFIKKEVL